MVHACCWAHTRRKFFEAAKLNPSDVAATRMVAQIDDLFGKIDAQAREQNLDHAARHALRLSGPSHWWRSSAGGRGARDAAYLPARWGRRRTTALALAEAHALPGVSRVGVSNSLAENSIARGSGRKNWIHVGSQQAGPKVAAFCPSWKAAAG